MQSLLNRYANGNIPLVPKAVMLTIFPFGSIHLTISYVSAIVTGNYENANAFHVLALDVIWPELAHGVVNFWISQTLALVFIFWLFYLSRQQKAKQSSNK